MVSSSDNAKSSFQPCVSTCTATIRTSEFSSCWARDLRIGKVSWSSFQPCASACKNVIRTAQLTSVCITLLKFKTRFCIVFPFFIISSNAVSRVSKKSFDKAKALSKGKTCGSFIQFWASSCINAFSTSGCSLACDQSLSHERGG